MTSAPAARLYHLRTTRVILQPETSRVVELRVANHDAAAVNDRDAMPERAASPCRKGGGVNAGIPFGSDQASLVLQAGLQLGLEMLA